MARVMEETSSLGAFLAPRSVFAGDRALVLVPDADVVKAFVGKGIYPTLCLETPDDVLEARLFSERVRFDSRAYEQLTGTFRYVYLAALTDLGLAHQLYEMGDLSSYFVMPVESSTWAVFDELACTEIYHDDKITVFFKGPDLLEVPECL